jgi:hypothetical protein
LILARVQIAQIQRLPQRFKHALQRSDYQQLVVAVLPVAVLPVAVAEQSHLQQLPPKGFPAGRQIYEKLTSLPNIRFGSPVNIRHEKNNLDRCRSTCSHFSDPFELPCSHTNRWCRLR